MSSRKHSNHARDARLTCHSPPRIILKSKWAWRSHGGGEHFSYCLRKDRVPKFPLGVQSFRGRSVVIDKNLPGLGLIIIANDPRTAVHSLQVFMSSPAELHLITDHRSPRQLNHPPALSSRVSLGCATGITTACPKSRWAQKQRNAPPKLDPNKHHDPRRG